MKPEVLKLREDAVATLQARHKIVVTKKGRSLFRNRRRLYLTLCRGS